MALLTQNHADREADNHYQTISPVLFRRLFQRSFPLGNFGFAPSFPPLSCSLDTSAGSSPRWEKTGYEAVFSDARLECLESPPPSHIILGCQILACIILTLTGVRLAVKYRAHGSMQTTQRRRYDIVWVSRS